MTAYNNFIQDFPLRCKDLLISFESEAFNQNREVTLLIAIATAAFIIPYERIRPSNHKHIAFDRDRNAVSAVGKLENQSFKNWQSGTSWKIIEGIAEDIIQTGQVDGWAFANKRCKIPDKKLVGTILPVIRNALAHGSIFTYPRGEIKNPHPIEDLIFLSKKFNEDGKFTRQYNAVIVSPPDFRNMILDWIQFLEGLQFPTDIMQETIAARYGYISTNDYH